MSAPQIKSVSAVKKYGRSKTPKQRNARVAWKRIKDNIDDLVLKTGANPELGSVISRWVLFGHLTRAEGYAARLYGEIVGAHDRYFVDGIARNTRSPSYQRGTAGAEDIIARKERNGTIADYEREAKRAKKRWTRVQKVLAPYPMATDTLNDLCVHDKEIATELRPHVKIMLRILGEHFGIINPAKKDERS